MPNEKINQTLTKKSFERLLAKIFTTPKDAQEAKRTSVARPSDGYSGRCKSQDKTEGKED
jgi:hypothetical protein